jgi:hypothetical protein
VTGPVEITVLRGAPDETELAALVVALLLAAGGAAGGGDAAPVAARRRTRQHAHSPAASWQAGARRPGVRPGGGPHPARRALPGPPVPAGSWRAGVRPPHTRPVPSVSAATPTERAHG